MSNASLQHDDDMGVQYPDNPNTRLPAVLLLDTSGSMHGEPIRELNKALKLLEDEFNPETGDPQALRSVELAVVSFGGSVQTHNLRSGNGTVSDDNDAFVEAADYRAPTLNSSGDTPMGTAMRQALSILERRKQFYHSSKLTYFRPWIFLISDGAPTDSGWEAAANDAVQAEKGSHVTIFPIGVSGANLQILGRFSQRPALPLASVNKFRELFQFISNSLSAASTSALGTEMSVLTPEALSQWTQVQLQHG